MGWFERMFDPLGVHHDEGTPAQNFADPLGIHHDGQGGGKNMAMQNDIYTQMGFGGIFNELGINPISLLGGAFNAIDPDNPNSAYWMTRRQNEQSIQDQLSNLGATTEGLGNIMTGVGEDTAAFAGQQDDAFRRNLLQSVMGDSYDPNSSLAQNFTGIDREANPELYGAANQIAGTQAPTMAQPNWADQYAYQMANRPMASTSTWNRFDQNADTMRNQPMAQMRNIDDPTWAMENVYKNVYSGGPGQFAATGNLNEIFNYSPEANRAREITGARLSDGGGENLAYAYAQARGLNKQGTGVDTETAARDKLLADMGVKTQINAPRVGLRVDNEGAISDRELRDATQEARAGFNDRGRVRDTGAVIGEITANEDARRARRQERNTNYLNQANVGLADAQNQLQANLATGSQNLARMGQANQILGDRFNQRMAADNTVNQRMLESIGAMSGTDAQRFNNFLTGVNTNMGIDADYQNRVDRYLGQEMQQKGFNSAQNQQWLGNLMDIEGDWQNRQAFANQAALQQDALRSGRLNEYMSASDNWNQRMLQDDALARQRMGDYQGISTDWQGRQQQDFLNQLGQGQAAYGAYSGLRQDPYSMLGSVTGSRIEPGNLMQFGQGMGESDKVGYADLINLTNQMAGSAQGVALQSGINDANRDAALMGALGTIGGGIGGFFLGGPFGAAAGAAAGSQLGRVGGGG